MSPVLQDKVAIITGASQGFGKAFSLKFAEEGADLLLTTTHLEKAEMGILGKHPLILLEKVIGAHIVLEMLNYP